MAEAVIFASMESNGFQVTFLSLTLSFSNAIIDRNSSSSRSMLSIICHLTLNKCIPTLFLPSKGRHMSLKIAINYSVS